MIGKIIFKAGARLSGKRQAALAKAITASAAKRSRNAGNTLANLGRNYVKNVNRRRLRQATKVKAKSDNLMAKASNYRSIARRAADDKVLADANLRIASASTRANSERISTLNRKLAKKNTGLLSALRRRELRSLERENVGNATTLSQAVRASRNYDTLATVNTANAIRAERQAAQLARKYEKLSKPISGARVALGAAAQTTLAVGAGGYAVNSYLNKRNQNGNKTSR
jgi:hypothetical protein